jgi:hypothetical protein
VAKTPALLTPEVAIARVATVSVVIRDRLCVRRAASKGLGSPAVEEDPISSAAAPFWKVDKPGTCATGQCAELNLIAEGVQIALLCQ